PSFDGTTDTLIAADVVIAGATPGNPVVHAYTVTVTVAVPANLTPDAADCTLGPEESGTGLSNDAALMGAAGESTADACVELPTTAFDKAVVTLEPNGDGTYTVTYSLTVTRTGDGPNYRLTDELRYGDAVTVVGQPTVTAPAGVTPNPDFDGTADTVIADDVAIADGESHV